MLERHQDWTAIAWPRSFHTDRTQQISFNDVLSFNVIIPADVRQGCVLGQLLFLLYSADVPAMHPPPFNTGSAFIAVRVMDKAVYTCSLVSQNHRLHWWNSLLDLHHKRLNWICDKTHFIRFGSRQQRLKVGTHIDNGHVMRNVCNLRVHLDCQMTMNTSDAAVDLPCMHGSSSHCIATLVHYEQAWVLQQPAGRKCMWSDRPTTRCNESGMQLDYSSREIQVWSMQLPSTWLSPRPWLPGRSRIDFTVFRLSTRMQITHV